MSASSTRDTRCASGHRNARMACEHILFYVPSWNTEVRMRTESSSTRISSMTSRLDTTRKCQVSASLGKPLAPELREPRPYPRQPSSSCWPCTIRSALGYTRDQAGGSPRWWRSQRHEIWLLRCQDLAFFQLEARSHVLREPRTAHLPGPRNSRRDRRREASILDESADLIQTGCHPRERYRCA